MHKLTELVESNQSYVSQVINDSLQTNFRTFLNGYRIKEAQKLLLELDVERFSVDSIGTKVGFKSPSGFRAVFKEVTGVCPTYFIKQEKT